MQGVLMYANEMHDLAIHRHRDVTRAIAVIAATTIYVFMNIAPHHPTTCTGTIEDILQVAALIEQGNGLHFKQ